MVGSSPGMKRQKPPKYLLTIDPGDQTGWALFKDGVLVECGYGKSAKIMSLGLLARRRGVVVVEIPVIYPGHKQKKPPQKILRAAVLGGRFMGRFEAGGHDVQEVSPKEWKGTVPKPAKASEEYIITRRVLQMCSEEEARLIKQTKSARAKQLNHNLIDAVGIGFWWLGRKQHEVSRLDRRRAKAA